MLLHPFALGLGEDGLAPRAGVEVVDDAQTFSLGKQLLDEASREAEALVNARTRGIATVADVEDANPL